MAPPVWATDEQLVRLNAFLPTYLDYGERANYPECWPQLLLPWFKSWPAEPIPLPNLDELQSTPALVVMEVAGLTVKQINAAKAKAKRDADWQSELRSLRSMTDTERAKWCLAQGIEKKTRVCDLPDAFDDTYIDVLAILQQLKSWFRWRQSALTNTSGQRLPNINIAELLSISTKGRKRALTEVEKYSSMYYPTRVAATVQAYLDGLGIPPSRSQTLTTVKRVTKEKWEAEDDATRNIVLGALAEDKAQKGVTPPQVEGRTTRTPADYQK